MTPFYKIIRIRPDQFIDIATLYRSIYASEDWQVQKSPPDYEAVLKQSLQVIFMLQIKTKNEVILPIGFLHLGLGGEAAEIIDFGILPAYRHQGYAQILCEHVVQFSIYDGYTHLVLDVADNNPAAIAFYKQQGFVEIHRRKKYYQSGADAIVMQLVLSA